MAELIPFPSHRRIGLIRTCAEQMHTRRPEAAERLLTYRLNQYVTAMVNKGMPAYLIAPERERLEHAILAHLVGYRVGGSA